MMCEHRENLWFLSPSWVPITTPPRNSEAVESACIHSISALFEHSSSVFVLVLKSRTASRFRMVQEYCPKTCQPRTTLAIHSRMSNVRYHTDRHEQQTAMAQPVLFWSPWAGASGENMSQPTAGLPNGQQQSGVSLTAIFSTYLSEPAGSRHSSSRRSDCLGAICSHFKRPSHYGATPVFVL